MAALRRSTGTVGLAPITDVQTFRSLARTSQKGRAAGIAVAYVPQIAESALTPKADQVCVAFSIGKKVGTAVKRNQIKRRLKEIMRRQCPSLLPGAYLIKVSPSAATMDYLELNEKLATAVERLFTTTKSQTASSNGRHAAP